MAKIEVIIDGKLEVFDEVGEQFVILPASAALDLVKAGIHWEGLFPPLEDEGSVGKFVQIFDEKTKQELEAKGWRFGFNTLRIP